MLFHIGIITIAAAVAGFLARITNQPLIPSYIIAGVLLGPLFGIVQNSSIIATLSELGIVFLLFLVGLEIDLSKLRPIANVAVIGGLAQIFFVSTLGYIAGSLLGFTTIESIYLGLIIAMSSTMVVVKLLSDRKELDTVHGRVTVGLLIMQDIVAIAALLFLHGSTSFFSLMPFKIAGIVAVTVVGVRLLSPVLFSLAGQVQELLLFMSLSICFFFALIFQWQGLSVSLGAFIAGLALANQPYHIEMTSKVRALRDFFATLFFVSLGLQVSPVTGLVYPLLVFIMLTVILKPVLILGICSAFGYSKRPAFLSSLSLAQVSEFSLILAAQGFSLGQLSEHFFSLTVILTLCTITLSSYALKFEPFLYKAALPILVFLEKCHLVQPPFMLLPPKKKWDVVICGFHRMGHDIYHGLKAKQNVLVIDFDPDILLHAAKEKVPFVYGDVTDADVLAHVHLKQVHCLVSTVPDLATNLSLLALVKKVNKKLPVIATAHYTRDAIALYHAGAAYVIFPHMLGGRHATKLLLSSSPAALVRERVQQLRTLARRTD